MKSRITRRAPVRTIEPGQIAITCSPEPFLFPTGHHNRGASCLICRAAIGGQPVTVVAVSAVNLEACACSGLASDGFLLHAYHFPIEQTVLQAALHRALHCSTDHDR